MDENCPFHSSQYVFEIRDKNSERELISTLQAQIKIEKSQLPQIPVGFPLSRTTRTTESMNREYRDSTETLP